MKCNCGSKSTGWTTIACCNICGLPIPTEPWEINPELVCGRAENFVMPKIAEVYICKYKILGFPFGTFDKQKAENWVSEDEESRYYDTIKIE